MIAVMFALLTAALAVSLLGVALAALWGPWWMAVVWALAVLLCGVGLVAVQTERRKWR